MNPERWHRIECIFEQALGKAPESRGEFLVAECAGDEVLYRQVTRLLDCDAHPRPDLEEALPDRVAPTRDPWIGQTVGSYRLTERLAEGGMAVVYRAERSDGAFEQQVAVKIVRRAMASEQVLRRFEAERQTLANLDHPNIARLLDGGATEDGIPFLVMELIEGVPIDEYCRREGLSISERLALIRKVCAAVHCAHRSLVVHRDLKPNNILIDAAGNPKLVDFGIAKILSDEEDPAVTPHTQTGFRLLTPDYASPEQLQGQPITTATDIYSLGVVLYLLVTGRMPQGGGDTLDRIESICTTDPPRPSLAVSRDGLTPDPGGATTFAATCGVSVPRLVRRLIGDVDNIVMMALRKEPARRYVSASQFGEDIERSQRGMPIIARADTVLYRCRKFVRRNRIVVFSVTAILLALVAGTVTTARMAAINRHERDVARAAESRAGHETVHARIEADSATQISDFLINTVLGSEPFADAAARDDLARSLARQADVCRRRFQDQVHLRANLLDALGRVALQLDAFPLAEELMEESLALRRTEFGEESLEMALSLRSRGLLQHARGDYPDAVGALTESLRLHRTCEEGVHTDVAAAANDLACALRITGRHAEAEALHQEALELRRTQNGKCSPEVATSLNNLAYVAMDTGRLERALTLLQEAEQIRAEVLGQDHPHTIQVRTNLAVTVAETGDVDRAEELLRSAVESYRRAGGQGATGLAGALSNLAELLLRTGKLRESRALYEEALVLHQARVGPDHPECGAVLLGLAAVERRSGRPERARELFEQSLEVFESEQLADHPIAMRVRCDFGNFLCNRGQHDEAEFVLRQAVDDYESVLEAPHYSLAIAVVSLGTCLTELGEYEEAEEWLRDGVDQLRELERPDDALKVAEKRLARLHTLQESAQDG